jgi:hypothetical protein
MDFMKIGSRWSLSRVKVVLGFGLATGGGLLPPVKATVEIEGC